MLDSEFGKRFTKILENSGISNARITELANISKNNIGNYKNGQIPNATTLYKLSQILGISMEYLIAGKEAEELTPEEQQLVNYYRWTNPTGRSLTLQTAKANSEALPADPELKEEHPAGVSASAIG